MGTSETILLKKLGNNIKKLRELRGLSREQVAESLDISPTWFRKMENGQAKISFKTLDDLSVILKVEMTDIIQFDENNSFTNHHHQQGPFHGTYIDKSVSNGEEKERELYERLLKEKDAEIDMLKNMVATLTELVKK